MDTILDKVLDVFFSFLQWCVDVLPNYNPLNNGTDLFSSMQSIVDAISNINNVFPVTEIVQCVAILGTFKVMMILWRPILKFMGVA